jgi:hypothetical protein
MPHPINENPAELRSASEYADEVMQRIQQDMASPLVRTEEILPDGRVAVILTDRSNPGFVYDFHCSTLDDALQWISHLAPKTWVTKRHLEILAYLMRQHFTGARSDG